MPIVLLAIDPETDGSHCPALHLDTDTGDLLFQGPEVTEKHELAQVSSLSAIGPGEIVGRIPARMRGAVLQALLEAENADSGVDRLQ